MKMKFNNEQIKGVKFLVDKTQFGNYIKEKRIALGLTQEELATKLYISATAVSKWENGKTYPDITVISQICNVLKISADEFVTACDDTEIRKQAHEAEKYSRLKKTTFWLLQAAFAIPVFICLILLFVNLTIAQFGMIVGGIGIGYSVVVLPFMVRREKLLWSLIGMSACIALILICYAIYHNQYVDLPINFAVFALISILPWGLWAVIRFTNSKVVFSLIAFGSYIATFGYPLEWIIGERGGVNPPNAELWAGSVFILIGVGLWLYFQLRKKRFAK
jgi:transcriptional regulator with XRE-family HTH domain